MMFNVPVPGGTTGHAVGASLAAIAIGPWATVLAVSFALLIQALIFGDGGVSALGANCLNMAVFQTFASVFIWNALRPTDVHAAPRRVFGAAFLSGYIGLIVAAIATAIQFGIQPALERAADGTPLYAPYTLHIALPAMFVSHLLLGLVEGAVTGLLVLALVRSRTLTLDSNSQLADAKPLHHRKTFWAAAAIMIIAVPMGLWLPNAFNAGDAWGEWSPEEAAERAGMKEVPKGMARFAGLWRAPVPDYAFKPESGAAAESMQYILAAVIGVVVISGFFALLGRRKKVPH